MSIYRPTQLILGGLLLSLFVAPSQLAAQTPTPELIQAAGTVGKVATVEPTLLLTQESPRPRRVQFARGTNFAVLQNSVVRGTRDTYLLNARRNQRMTVSITSLENNAIVDIIGPNGRTIQQEMTSWSFILPTTGDYQLVVSGTRGNATYKLRVEIN